MLQKFTLIFLVIFGVFVAACEADKSLPTSHLEQRDESVSLSGESTLENWTSPEPQTQIPSQTYQLSSTPTPTETIAPTFTSSSTSSPSPTATQTLTLTPTPTPFVVLPGYYPVGGCAETTILLGIKYTLCVTGITVERNHHMIVHMTWAHYDIPKRKRVYKRSDKGNTNMYMVDEYGNRYDHINGGGAAYRRVYIQEGKVEEGWFEFEAPVPGANIFSFYDDDQHIAIHGLGLGVRIVLYEEFPLTSDRIVLEYPVEDWQLEVTEDGDNVLVHKTIPSCTLREHPDIEPKGRRKNTIDLGEITYDIYGYIESGKEYGVREYLVVSGLEDIGVELRPFFYVTLPLDDSRPCALDISKVLARLYPADTD